MLTLSGVASESMVRDVGWTMMDIGKRIERGLWLTALLGATLTAVRSAAAEQTVIESTLVACESSVIYRRRTVGKVSVAAVTELMLFDADNPRSLLYQLERLRADLKDLPGSSGSSRPERIVDEISTRLRRSHPAELGKRSPPTDVVPSWRTCSPRYMPSCAIWPKSSPKRSWRCLAACSRCGAPTNDG